MSLILRLVFGPCTGAAEAILWLRCCSSFKYSRSGVGLPGVLSPEFLCDWRSIPTLIFRLMSFGVIGIDGFLVEKYILKPTKSI